MRLVQTGPPLAQLSPTIGIAEEPSGFVMVEVPVRIEPPPKHLPRLNLACSVGPRDIANRVLEQSKIIHNRLPFRIPQEHCSQGECLTLSADLDGAMLWQKCYRLSWKQLVPFLEELS